jgi:hypothetical protein
VNLSISPSKDAVDAAETTEAIAGYFHRDI